MTMIGSTVENKVNQKYTDSSIALIRSNEMLGEVVDVLLLGKLLNSQPYRLTKSIILRSITSDLDSIPISMDSRQSLTMEDTRPFDL